MNWKVLNTESDHNRAVKRAKEIFFAEPGTSEDDELGILLLLIKDYEDRNIVMPEVDVLEFIKEKMQEKGLKNKDLIPVIGSKGYVSAILSGKRDLTLKMAARLKDFLNVPAEMFLQVH
jgi:HTH-type transcriptional regulator/antitoxin HigA